MPRQFRNVLIFVAPDAHLATFMDQEVRQFLSWKSILEDAESLNLDAHQHRQATDNLARISENVNVRIQEMFCWLLIPTPEGTGTVSWNLTRIPGGTESYVSKASKKLKDNEQLISHWSPANLKMELDKWLWKDQMHLSIKTLWEYYSSYLYLSRLRDSDVLLDTIREGIRSKDYFGYANGIDGKGHYLGLSFGKSGSSVYLDESGRDNMGRVYGTGMVCTTH
jgi:hypothetical protein